MRLRFVGCRSGFRGRAAADLAGWVADVARIYHRPPLAIDVTLTDGKRTLQNTKADSHGTR